MGAEVFEVFLIGLVRVPSSSFHKCSFLFHVVPEGTPLDQRPVWFNKTTILRMNHHTSLFVLVNRSRFMLGINFPCAITAVDHLDIISLLPISLVFLVDKPDIDGLA